VHLRGWDKKNVNESDAADERKIEPSSSSAGIGCGMLVRKGWKPAPALWTCMGRREMKFDVEMG
jgi:hypothetical protein